MKEADISFSPVALAVVLAVSLLSELIVNSSWLIDAGLMQDHPQLNVTSDFDNLFLRDKIDGRRLLSNRTNMIAMACLTHCFKRFLCAA